MTSMTQVIDNRIQSEITVFHVVTEYSGGSWNDTNGNGWFDVFAWVKNVGTARIDNVEECDLFFGEERNLHRYSHYDYASGTPNWVYDLEGGAAYWAPERTIKITLRYASDYAGSGLSTDTRYDVKLCLDNGICDDAFLSW